MIELELCVYCGRGFREKRLERAWQDKGHIYGPYHQRCLEELVAEGKISVEMIRDYGNGEGKT